MVKREEYIKAVQVILDFDAECNRLSNSFHTLLAKDDHRPCITFGAPLLKAYITRLERLCGDESCQEASSTSWLQWWLYDATKPESRWATINHAGGSTHYRAHDAGELYDLIQAWLAL